MTPPKGDTMPDDDAIIEDEAAEIDQEPIPGLGDAPPPEPDADEPGAS